MPRTSNAVGLSLLALVAALMLTTRPIGARAALIPASHLTAPQPESAGRDSPTKPLRDAIPGIDARLAELGPDNPGAYYLLAEEIAYEAVEAADLALARQLYVLAYALSERKRPGDVSPASVCLALRAIEISQPVRDWLTTVSESIDTRYAATDWNTASTEDIPPQVALLAAEALGLVRAGEGLRARRLLENPEIRAVFERYETLLGSTGARGALQRTEADAAIWPCPECSNARYVTRLDAQSKPVTRLCGTCHGNPGPRISESEFIAHMRFESHLLSGVQQSWAAQIALDQGAPLIDLDLGQILPTLFERYDADPDACWWRGGAWSKTR